MYVRGKGKEDYVTGVVVVHMKEDPKFKAWNAGNNMVMSWLINSMAIDIGESFMFYETTREIWEVAKETFFDKENTSELFGIESNLHDIHHGDLFVTQYFNLLKWQWQQLDRFEVYDWKDLNVGLKYKNII